MGNNDERDRYDRPSWKELDRRKDGRSDGSEGGKKRGNLTGIKTAKEEYIKSIDGVFAGISGNLKADLSALKASLKQPDFTAKTQAFVAKHGYPKDFDTLMLAMDCKDLAIVLAAAISLKEHLVCETQTRKTLFAGKLRLLKLMHDSPSFHLELEKLG